MTTTVEESRTEAGYSPFDYEEFQTLNDEAEICEGGWNGDECENEAEYIIAMKCCGHRALLCEDCLFELQELLRDKYSECMKCHFRFGRSEQPVKVVGRV